MAKRNVSKDSGMCLLLRNMRCVSARKKTSSKTQKWLLLGWGGVGRRGRGRQETMHVVIFLLAQFGFASHAQTELHLRCPFIHMFKN